MKLQKMLTHEDLSKVRLLVLANKQDVKGCMTAAEISQERIQISYGFFAH